MCVCATGKVKAELKKAVAGYMLRQRSLDDALSARISDRDFDWDADMRRMMDAVQVGGRMSGGRIQRCLSYLRQIISSRTERIRKKRTLSDLMSLVKINLVSAFQERIVQKETEIRHS